MGVIDDIKNKNTVFSNVIKNIGFMLLQLIVSVGLFFITYLAYNYIQEVWDLPEITFAKYAVTLFLLGFLKQLFFYSNNNAIHVMNPRENNE